MFVIKLNFMVLRSAITPTVIILLTIIAPLSFSNIIEFTDTTNIVGSCSTNHLINNGQLTENETYSDTTFVFDLENKAYELCYITSGKIWFYDIKSAQKVKFPCVKNAFHLAFTKDKKTMFYTSKKADKGFLLNKVAFSGTKVTVYHSILDIDMELDRFVTPTYEETGRMVVFKDTLIIEYDFEWLDCFYKAIKYSIKNNSVLFDQNNTLFSTEYENATKQKNEHTNLIDKIEMLEIDGKKELFLCNITDTILLTNTSELDKEFEQNEDDEHYVEKDISIKGISPDGTNLLFGVILHVNDLAHGPYYIVDLKGKNQQMILDDGFAGNYEPVWLPDGKNITTGAIITGENNSIIVIDDPIDYYVLRL